MDRASLERMLAQGLSLEQIGRRFGRDPSTVGYWVKKHGLLAAHRAKHASRGGIPRERLEALVSEGGSIRSIARTVGFSETAVKYWLQKYGLSTHGSARRREGRAAKREGRAIVQMTCRHHGLTDFWLEGRGAYRCLRCRGEAVSRWRRNAKLRLVAEAGGCCQVCGYQRYVGALEFHHLDPSTKSFSLAQNGVTRSYERLRAEARKCALVCANCHAEVEAGIVALPEQSAVPPTANLETRSGVAQAD
jgi:transposase